MGTKRMGLGKGLGALIPDMGQEQTRNILYCGIEEVAPNRSQPRKRFEESKLQELAESIREKGILEPLIVRRVGDGYEIVVGERRWRAAQKAGLKEVPVLVREFEERDALEISLIENLQRESLNPIEEADGFRRLMEEFGMNQEEVALRVGKDRTTVANTLRLLRLPPEIREHLLQSRMTPGHARAILSLESPDRQMQLCEAILQKGLSVREAEALAKRYSGRSGRPAAGRKKDELESQMKAIEDSLRQRLGTKVRILQKGRKGRVEIEYYSPEDLERVVEAILGEQSL
jgi:ParB family transcriptional regulator, chromosome partitioning protein